MKILTISKLCNVIVDDEDYDRLKAFKWYDTGTGLSRITYKQCGAGFNRKQVKTHISIANEIFNTRGLIYDHINSNYKDNQKSNLRVASYSQNNHHKHKKPNCKSVYKGVCSETVRDGVVYRASIRINYKLIYLGRFKDEVSAALAYDKKALELFGSFATLNFPVEKSNVKL